MRYILLVFFAFITTFASAQVQFLGSPTTTVRNRGNFVSDSLFYLPKRQKLPSDTGALRYQISDSALYVWTGSAWRSTGTAGSAITGSGVAGYMPEFTTSTNLDTTRLYHSAGRFAIGSTTTTNGVFNVYGGQTYFDTSLKIGTQTLLADEGKNEVYVNTTSDAGAYPLQVGGSINIADNSSLSSAGRELLFMGTSGTTYIKSSGVSSAIIFQPNNVSDSVMYYGTDYELKIATSADAGNYKLQVAGAIYNTGNAALAASGGNVGIGTVSPTEALHVVGRGRFTTIDSTSTPINVLTSDVNGVVRKTSISATGIQGSGTTNYIPKFTASGTIGNSKLSDDGSTLTYLNDVIVFGENNTNTKYIKFSSSTGDFYFSTSSSIHQINGTGTKALQFQTNNTERMRLTSDGELLIGTTTDAGAYALQVAGSIYNTTGAVLAASSGNVGIGTTPSGWTIGKAVDIANGMGLLGYLNQSYYVNNAYFDGAWRYKATSAAAKYEQQLGGEHTWANQVSGTAGDSFNWTERMRINASGELLIGTTTDAGAYALQVTGAIYNTTTITTGAPTGGSIKPWRLGEAATVSPTSPNRTIRVEIDGTVYYIHAKTTND